MDVALLCCLVIDTLCVRVCPIDALGSAVLKDHRAGPKGCRRALSTFRLGYSLYLGFCKEATLGAEGLGVFVTIVGIDVVPEGALDALELTVFAAIDLCFLLFILGSLFVARSANYITLAALAGAASVTVLASLHLYEMAALYAWIPSMFWTEVFIVHLIARLVAEVAFAAGFVFLAHCGSVL